jgi:hypothetical protein
MMMTVMRALLSTADDEDEVGRLGRSFDQAGDRLEREFDTSNRVKINDVPILGKAVEALARMHGDDGTKQDYWLRVRNIPYAAPMLAMASTMSWLGADETKAKGYKDESLNAWREFVSDFVSEGIVMSAVNAVHGNESKYVRGQPVSATLGAMAVDLGLSRIAPVPLLSAARDLVDPNMRRLNKDKSLDYYPGFVEGVKSRIPGLADSRTICRSREPSARARWITLLSRWRRFPRTRKTLSVFTPTTRASPWRPTWTPRTSATSRAIAPRCGSLV